MTSTLNIPKNVLDLAPWSTSMAGLAVNCPHAFNLRYRKREKAVDPAPESQTIGNVVHKILEFAIQGVPLSRVFQQVLPAFELTHNMRETVMTFRDAVEDFVRRLDNFKTQFKVKETFPERKLAITPAFKKTNFFDKKGLFRGVVDVTMLLDDGRCVVLDHKTGAHKPISMHQDQLEGYAVVLKANYPTITSVRAGLNYVGGDPQPDGKRIVWASTHDSNTITTRLQQSLVKQLTKAADSVKSDEPRKGWMCNFCGYKAKCPLYK